MNKNLILENATIITFFISLILAFFLFTVKSKKHNKISNRLIGLFLLTLSIHISVFFYSKYFRIPIIFEQLRDQLILFYGPLLYLYFISSMYLDFKLEKKHLLHLIPFALVSIVFIPRFFFANHLDKITFYESYHSQVEAKIYTVLNGIFITFYFVRIFIELKMYKKILLENYSGKRYFNYKWLEKLAILLSLIFLISFFRTAVLYSGNENIILNMRIFHTLLLLIFVTWIILKSLYSPEIFKPVNLKHRLQNVNYINNITHNTSYKTYAQENNEKVLELKSYIEKNKPFLRPTLTITELANEVGMKNQDLSILINQHMGKHFFDFINEYRVKMAVGILQNPARKSSHILEILYEVGFNSKSSFHRAFKKHTGKTPKEFRKGN